MAVDGQFRTLMHTPYRDLKATFPRPFASVEAMWIAFSDMMRNKTPAVNGEKHFPLPVSSAGARSIAPLEPRPAELGRGLGPVPSQSLSWQAGSCHCPTIMPIDDSSDHWFDQTSNCWALKEHRSAENFAVITWFKADHPPSLERPPFTLHLC